MFMFLVNICQDTISLKFVKMTVPWILLWGRTWVFSCPTHQTLLNLYSFQYINAVMRINDDVVLKASPGCSCLNIVVRIDQLCLRGNDTGPSTLRCVNKLPHLDKSL